MSTEAERAAFKEKIASIGFGRHAGSSRRVDIPSDSGPGMSGFQTEHWDGRVDATCTRPQVTVNPELVDAAREAYQSNKAKDPAHV